MTAQALVMTLQATGRGLTRVSFIRMLGRSGVTARWSSNEHPGSHFVDLSMFSREARFIH